MEDISVEQRLKGRNQGVVLERVDWRKQGLKTQSCEMVVFLIITSQKNDSHFRNPAAAPKRLVSEL